MKHRLLAACAALTLCAGARADPVRILDALVQFGVITGLNPLLLGSGDQAARDLGIGTADALTLQRIAAIEIGAVPEPKTPLLLIGGVGVLVWMRRRRRRG